LTSALTGGQALASVTNYYLQGKSPGSSVTVYDSQGNYPRALAGAKGKARWNDRQRRYEIVECNQMAIALACTLGSDMCSGTSAGSITGHTVLTFPPYGQTPVPLPGVARNYYHLAGRAGDWCLVLWDEDIDDWAKPQAWKNVLTFQEQAVLVAAAGAGSCITFQEVTVCTPCIGPGDTSQVCANVETKVDCVCSCSCNCNCGDSGGGGYPSSGGDSGGGGSGSCSCSCTCTCKAKSVITFG